MVLNYDVRRLIELAAKNSKINTDGFFNEYPQEEQFDENYEADLLELQNTLNGKFTEIEAELGGFFNEYPRDDEKFNKGDFYPNVFKWNIRWIICLLCLSYG